MEPFSFPQLTAAAPDEALLYDVERYERHKKAQLFRPPAVSAEASQRIQLPEGSVPETMARRRSHRRFSPACISSSALGAALGAFRHARDGEGIRALYPSAGGVYGLDFYLHVKAGRVDGVPGGVYYYHPAAHSLHRAGDEAALGKDVHHHNNRPVFAGSAFTLIIVFDAATTAPVYGASSLSLAAIETGLALGTFIQLAEAAQIGVCPIGLVDFPAVSLALRLPPGHAVLHLAECGQKPPHDDPVDAAPDPTPDLSVSGLRQFLAATLPDYMVPSQFVLIDEIPLTPNNKVDREALLKMEGRAELDLGTQFVAAESDFEARLLEIWQRVLKRESIGVEDNFFDLGGDSIGVAEVHAHILGEWKQEVPIVKLFRFPTIRAIAGFLRSQAGISPAATPTPAPPAADPSPLPQADRDALNWIRAHPDDPRAGAIAAKLRGRNVLV
jgi:SagB-type dehydrogenase family enzyme